MGFLSKIFGGRLQGPAAYLCRVMATENDRVMVSQIQIFAEPMYWPDGKIPPANATPHPESLIVARLMGAAAPLAVVKLADPDSFNKVFKLALKFAGIWTSNGTRVKLPGEMVEAMLRQFVDLFVELVSNDGDSNSEQAAVAIVAIWVSALALSWGETDGANFTRPLFQARGETLAIMFMGSVGHAKQELGFHG